MFGHMGWAEPMNQMDLVDRVRRKRETIVKMGRLLNLKCFICKKTVCNRCVV